MRDEIPPLLFLSSSMIRRRLFFLPRAVGAKTTTTYTTGTRRVSTFEGFICSQEREARARFFRRIFLGAGREKHIWERSSREIFTRRARWNPSSAYKVHVYMCIYRLRPEQQPTTTKLRDASSVMTVWAARNGSQSKIRLIVLGRGNECVRGEEKWLRELYMSSRFMIANWFAACKLTRRQWGICIHLWMQTLSGWCVALPFLDRER